MSRCGLGSMREEVAISASQEEALDAIPGWDDVQQAGRVIDDTPSQPQSWKFIDDMPSQSLALRDIRDAGAAELVCSQSSSQQPPESRIFDVTGSSLSDHSQEAVEWLSPEEDGLSSSLRTGSGHEQDAAARGEQEQQQQQENTCYNEAFESDRSRSPSISPSRRRLSWNLAAEGRITSSAAQTKSEREEIARGAGEVGAEIGLQMNNSVRSTSDDGGNNREAARHLKDNLGPLLAPRPPPTGKVAGQQQHQAESVNGDPIRPRESLPPVLGRADQQQEQATPLGHENLVCPRESHPLDDGIEQQEEQQHQTLFASDSSRAGNMMHSLAQPPPAVQEKLDRLRSRQNVKRKYEESFTTTGGGLRGNDDSRLNDSIMPETLMDAFRMRALRSSRRAGVANDAARDANNFAAELLNTALRLGISLPAPSHRDYFRKS